MATSAIDPALLQRLLNGESVDGYWVGRGNYVGPQITESADGSGDPSNYEKVIYGQTSKDGWKTNNWNTWNIDGSYRGQGSGDSDALAGLKFVGTALAGYYGAQGLAGTGAGAGAGGEGALGGSLGGGTSTALDAAEAATTAGTGGSLAGSGGLATGAGSGAGLATTATKAGAGSLSGWDVLGKAAGTVAGLAGAGAAANGLASNGDTSKLDQLLSTYLTEMGKTSARGDDQWNQYLTTFRPLETKLATTALNYDTPERREQAANEAMGGVASQFDVARQQGLRDMLSSGVDPSTISALGTASLVDEAKAKASAANSARTQVEDRGIQLVDNASRFGRNLPGTSLNASSVATGQGNSAAQTSGLSNQINTNSTNSRNAIFGDLLGAGLKAYGMGLFGG